MIGQFPSFTPIDFDLKSAIVNFTRQFEAYEDFSFVNLYTWNIDERAGVSWLNDNLVIKIPNYLNSSEFSFTFIGQNNLDQTVAELVKEFGFLELIPAFVIKGLEHPEKYAIAEDRDSFDYIYSVEKLAELSGRALRKKRNIAKTTRKTIGDKARFITVNNLTKKQREGMREVIEAWFSHTTQPEADVRSEYIALGRTLEYFSQLDLWATVCYIEERIVGFSIHEIVNEEFSICHFEKSLNNIVSGLNTVLIQEAARFLVGKSKLVNWQQDLGILGLKKAKQAYAPLTYLRKYWINKDVADLGIPSVN